MGAIQEYLQNNATLRSNHEDAFFDIAVLHLWRKYLKNTFDEVQFLVKRFLVQRSTTLKYRCESLNVSSQR